MVISRKKDLYKRLKRCWPLYILILPSITYILIYKYYPIFLQVVLSFKEYRLRDGVWGSEWVGFDKFNELFNIPEFSNILFNTIFISSLRLLVGFLPPIILAIMLFDLKSKLFRRASQTILYIPHFFSWVIVYAIVFAFFSNSGLINYFITSMGFQRQEFLLDKSYFIVLLIGSGLWKELGWGTIIYLAALTSINSGLYEAAKIDGAGPLKRIWHITIPGILPVMVFLFTLSIGRILQLAGAEQILLFYSPATYEVGDIIDTWVYRQGLVSFQYSLGAAASFFQSMFGLVLILAANKISTKYAGVGIW